MIGNKKHIVEFLKEQAQQQPLRKLKSEEWLCQEGDVCEGMFLIMEGKVVVNKNGHWVKFLKEGDLAGIATMNGGSISVNIKALEDTQLVFFEKKYLLEEMRKQPELHFSLIQLMCSDLDDIEKQIKLITFKDAHRKIAYMLLALYQLISQDKEPAISYGYERMATWNSISTRLFRQVINYFIDKHWVEKQGKSIKIVDADKLQAFALQG